MYQIKLDDYVLYDNRSEKLRVFEPKLQMEVNTTGALTFKIYPDHMYFDKIRKLGSIVKVYKDDRLIFRGRVLEDKEDFYKAKAVDCEGDLAFLLDSVYRPFNFLNMQVTVKQFFRDLIDNHNSQVKDFQKFKLGEVTVEDPNQKINFSSETSMKTWDLIQSRLIDTYGGYLYITYDENEMPVINYLEDFDDTSTQVIEFGKNMIDISHLISGQDIATAVMPYGAKLKDAEGNETSERLTIKDVNSGLDYIINEELAEEYGVIYANIEDTTWEDVTLPNNLLSRARDYLAESVKLSATIELKAVDLSYVYDIESFHFCEYIQVKSEFHNINKLYLLKKISIDILNPQNTEITLGETYNTLIDTTLSESKDKTNIATRVETIEKNYASNSQVSEIVNQTISNSTIVETTASQVVAGALSEYVEKSSFNEYKKTNAAELQVLAEEIVANFTQTTSGIQKVDGDLQQKYQEIHGYIRGYLNDTGDTTIELGAEQSTIKLKLENDEIWFDVNGQKRFYLNAEGKIVFKNAVFEETTEVGNGFGFVPRSNGNLSFKKVR